ncbi:MAG: NifB/NifX family molybdenum-iron cluster-binding protein [Bacteroidales bacterium]|nr:NifB/NifX family molybdenum-iron cluster-binding protein [Bacteroidales bacterium]
MKVLFSAKSEGWNAPMDDRFGRAEGFTLYNEETDELTWHSNQENKQAEHGVGIQAAQLVAMLQANVVITGGNFGPKASSLIQKTGAEMIEDMNNMSVKQAYESYKSKQ